jgi:hypothetical protein
MRACLMIVLERMSSECVFEREQKIVFCLLKEIIESHDSIFLFEQTVVSLAVRFKSLWVNARKEEEDKLIIDENVVRDSIWVIISIQRKCIRWYACSLECFHERAHSNLHSTAWSIKELQKKLQRELQKELSKEVFCRVYIDWKFYANSLSLHCNSDSLLLKLRFATL